MSGTALTTVSPSSVRIRRSVVCVAGCCGPKLSVQRYSLSSVCLASLWISSNGIACSISDCRFQIAEIKFEICNLKSEIWSAFRPRDDREVMAFAASAQRVVLAERKTRELLGHQDTAQVRMSFENDAVHVVDLALEPIRRLPQLERRRQAGARFVHEGLHEDALARCRVHEAIHDAEAVLRVRVFHIVDGGHFEEHIETALFLEAFQHGEEMLGLDDDA